MGTRRSSPSPRTDRWRGPNSSAERRADDLHADLAPDPAERRRIHRAGGQRREAVEEALHPRRREQHEDPRRQRPARGTLDRPPRPRTDGQWHHRRHRVPPRWTVATLSQASALDTAARAAEGWGVRVGVSFTPFETRADVMLRIAVRADAAGLERVDIAEGWTHDGFLVLAEIAAATRRIGLATGIVSMWGRTPATLALSAAGLQRLSGGRFALGIGAS